MSQFKNYSDLVIQLKEEIQTARIKASLNANIYLLALYWKIGNAILENQQSEGWGNKIIDRLAKDVRSEFPDMKGISSRNLKYMRAFAGAYAEFVQPVAAQIQGKLIVQAPLAQIRFSYIQQTAAHEWSRNVLIHEIESGLYKRKGVAITNFQATLP